MSERINLDDMIQKQQSNLIKLQKRLEDMKREYLMYKDIVEQLRNQMKANSLANDKADRM